MEKKSVKWGKSYQNGIIFIYLFNYLKISYTHIWRWKKYYNCKHIFLLFNVALIVRCKMGFYIIFLDIKSKINIVKVIKCYCQFELEYYSIRLFKFVRVWLKFLQTIEYNFSKIVNVSYRQFFFICFPKQNNFINLAVLLILHK